MHYQWFLCLLLALNLFQYAKIQQQRDVKFVSNIVVVAVAAVWRLKWVKRALLLPHFLVRYFVNQCEHMLSLFASSSSPVINSMLFYRLTKIRQVFMVFDFILYLNLCLYVHLSGKKRERGICSNIARYIQLQYNHITSKHSWIIRLNWVESKAIAIDSKSKHFYAIVRTNRIKSIQIVLTSVQKIKTTSDYWVEQLKCYTYLDLAASKIIITLNCFGLQLLNR